MSIDEAFFLSIPCVYCLTHPNGLQYIGQTNKLSNRLKLYQRQISGCFSDSDSVHLRALRLFGLDSCSIDILSSPSKLSAEDLPLCLSILEIKYIRQLNTLHPSVYNVSIGVELLGLPSCDLNTSGTLKPILVYDSDGNFLSESPSLLRCMYSLGIVKKNLSGYLYKNKVYDGKYVFRSKRYDKVPLHIETSSFKIVPRVRYQTVVEKRVVRKEVEYTPHVVPHALKYDEDGNFCGEYSSKCEALRTFSKSHSVPYGKYCNGYILYKKVSDDFPSKIEPYSETVGKILGDIYKPISECDDMPVLCSKRPSRAKAKLRNDIDIAQYTLDGTLVAKYSGIREASRITGVSYCKIWACVMGRTRKSAGYVWCKMNE